MTAQPLLQTLKHTLRNKLVSNYWKCIRHQCHYHHQFHCHYHCYCYHNYLRHYHYQYYHYFWKSFFKLFTPLYVSRRCISTLKSRFFLWHISIVKISSFKVFFEIITWIVNCQSEWCCWKSKWNPARSLVVSQLLYLQPKWLLLSRTALFPRRSGLILLEEQFRVSKKKQRWK